MERVKSRIRITAEMALSFAILGASAGRSWHQKNPTPVWEEDSEEPGDYTVDLSIFSTAAESRLRGSAFADFAPPVFHWFPLRNLVNFFSELYVDFILYSRSQVIKLFKLKRARNQRQIVIRSKVRYQEFFLIGWYKKIHRCKKSLFHLNLFYTVNVYRVAAINPERFQCFTVALNNNLF